MVDDDINTPGTNISYNGEGGFDLDGESRAFEERFMQWQDPIYHKNGHYFCRYESEII